MSIGKERLTGEKSPSEPASRVAKSFCNCCWIFHDAVPPSMRSKIREGGVVVRSKIRELGGELRRCVTNRPEREVSLDRPVSARPCQDSGATLDCLHLRPPR